MLITSKSVTKLRMIKLSLWLFDIFNICVTILTVSGARHFHFKEPKKTNVYRHQCLSI